jgi:hypothetical protein
MNVLELHEVVGRVQQRVELVVDLRLAGRADLVVGALDLETDGAERAHHVVAQVGHVVGGGDGEVAALVARLVAPVAALLLARGVPLRLDGVDLVVAGVLLGLEADVVEDVELRLGPEERRVGDAGALEVRLGTGGDLPRVAAVGLVGEGVHDRVRDDERLRRAVGVHVGGGRVRDQLHVGLVDRLEAADRRAVEHLAVLEGVGVERGRRQREVLHDAGQVAEADVDELDALLGDVLEDVVGRAEHRVSCR